MARGQTLESVLNTMRAEARLSLSAASNIQTADSHKILLAREQDRLWEDYDWPHLKVHHLIQLQAGQYEYDLPALAYDANTAGAYTLALDRVLKISVMDGGEWRPLCPEITEAEYNTHQTLLDERSWPVTHWQATEADQIEVWPIPDQNGDSSTYEGYLRVTGIRSLQAFVDDNDRADLDDRLLALYVAANVLAGNGAKDAGLKLETANKLYTKLKGNQTKTSSFNLFGANKSSLRVRRKPRINRYVP